MLLNTQAFGQKQNQDIVYHVSKKHEVSNLFGTWICAQGNQHGDSVFFEYSFHQDMRCDDLLMSNKRDSLWAPAEHSIFFLQTDTLVFRGIDDGSIRRTQILRLEKNFLRWVVLLDEGGRGAIMDFRRMSF